MEAHAGWENSRFGNLTAITTNGTTRSYAHDLKTNRTTELNYAYDDSGNLIQTPSATFTYDALGMVTTATDTGKHDLYVYTPDDERLAALDILSSPWRGVWTCGSSAPTRASSPNGTASAPGAGSRITSTGAPPSWLRSSPSPTAPNPRTTSTSTTWVPPHMSTPDKNTAMGCQNHGGSAGTAAVCERVAHFSNPDVDYLNPYPTGDASHDNARVAEDQLSDYEDLRSSVSVSEPTASFTKSCNSGTRQCTFNASGTTDDGSIVEYYWYYGNGVEATKASASHTYTYPGSGTFYWVHLITTDDDGQRDLAITNVTF